MADLSVPERLALLAYHLLFPDLFPETDTKQFDGIRLRVDDLWARKDPDLHRAKYGVRRDVTNPGANSSAVKDAVIWALAEPILYDKAEETGVDQPLVVGLTDEEVRYAAARIAVGSPGRGDRRRVTMWARNAAPPHPPPAPPPAAEPDHEDEKGADMADDDIWGPYEGEYEIDLRNTPENFDPDEFKEEIDRLFANRNAGDDDPLTTAHKAYVAGSLLRASYFDPDAPGFEETFVEFYNEGFDTVTVIDDDGKVDESPDVRDIEAYGAVAHQIAKLKDGAPSVQEVSAVADIVLDGGPINDNFAAKCRSALDDVVGKGFDYDRLDLPDVVTEETAHAEIEPGNVRSVAMVYAASNLEAAGLFSTCEQAAIDWSDGVLPVGENAGRLFDDFVFNARERLDPAARDIQFQRIDGLHSHLLRFCSAASERDRSKHLSEYLSGSRRSAQPRDAAVRKAARDLLAYASLHGWAYTQFAAKRLGNQIRQCIEIIDHREVQKAYGVSGPWQVVERVSSMTTGSTPDIPKNRALASTGKAIVDMLAAKAKAIGSSLASEPLFPSDEGRRADDGPDFEFRFGLEDGSRGAGAGIAARGRQARGRSVFTHSEYEQLMNHVENWLAANTVNDAQRLEQSQLRESVPSASLPSFGGVGGGGGGVDSEAVKNQLMQMVSAGQMPTADQVEQLFNFGI